jgi:hypothetical protein
MGLPFQKENPVIFVEDAKENPVIFVEDAKPSDRVAALTALRGELLKRHFVGFNGISGYMSLEVGRNSKIKLTLVIHLFWRRLGVSSM